MKHTKGQEPPANNRKNPSVAAKPVTAPEPATYPVENLVPRSLRDDDRLIRVLVDILRARGYEIAKLESGFGMKASDFHRARGEIAGIQKFRGAWSVAEKAAKSTKVSASAVAEDGSHAADEDQDDLSDEADEDELFEADDESDTDSDSDDDDSDDD